MLSTVEWLYTHPDPRYPHLVCDDLRNLTRPLRGADIILSVGKHKGRTLVDVRRTDARYLQFLEKIAGEGKDWWLSYICSRLPALTK